MFAPVLIIFIGIFYGYIYIIFLSFCGWSKWCYF